MVDHIVLEFPSNYKFLNVVDLVCTEFVSGMGFPEKTTNEISISVIEACTNALEHGNKCCPEENVRVVFIEGEGKVVIEIFDRGNGFDFKSYLRHIPDPLDMKKFRGRGIYIMNSMMDALDFEVLPDGGGMKVTLEKRLRAEN